MPTCARTTSPAPPLVVAYGIAGTVRTDLDEGSARHRQRRQARLSERHLADRRRSRRADEVRAEPEHFRREYGDLSGAKSCGKRFPRIDGAVYQWDPKSTYIKEPPFFDGVTRDRAKVNDIKGARALAILGDSITTDHISPSTKIKPGTPAGKWLEGYNGPPSECNNYGVAPLQP